MDLSHSVITNLAHYCLLIANPDLATANTSSKCPIPIRSPPTNATACAVRTACFMSRPFISNAANLSSSASDSPTLARSMNCSRRNTLAGWLCDVD